MYAMPCAVAWHLMLIQQTLASWADPDLVHALMVGRLKAVSEGTERGWYRSIIMAVIELECGLRCMQPGGQNNGHAVLRTLTTPDLAS
jgi:hypothetical protein